VLPTFVVIGAMKAGTTSLYEYLKPHPQIFLPEMKEVNFFVKEGNWDRGVEWYQSLYAEADIAGALHAGDVSPVYSMFPNLTGTPARIAATVPDARILYLVRDPVERMRSQYIQQRADGLEKRPLSEALLLDLRYLATSLYTLQLEQYLERFDRSRILVVRSEDLSACPQETVARVLSFLGLDPGWTPPGLGQVHNPSSDKRVTRKGVGRVENMMWRRGWNRTAYRFRQASRKSSLLSREVTAHETTLDGDLRERLRRTVRADIARLPALVGPDFDAWGLLEPGG
jgi:Sulfotransferase domain